MYSRSDLNEIPPSRSRSIENVEFFVPPDILPLLEHLPWQFPLENWSEHGARLLDVKSGVSRHVVRFIQTNGHRFAIKETSLENAKRELKTYMQLRRMGVHTLVPCGVVARSEGTEIVLTKIGTQLQERSAGYLLTELMEKVVPDSFLYKRGFTKENRKRIWDAVIRLFVEMHMRAVYWGDASLANVLINFSNEREPGLGYRTKLRAVLADAETVEIHRSISDTLRIADVEFFLESMQWTEADLRASGVVRETVISESDRQFILKTYQERYAIEQEKRSFELCTEIDVDRLLGDFDMSGYGKLLLKHINEHKWYLSERQQREVSVVDAAKDWYNEVFQPVCRVFIEYGFPGYFPDKTAASLYVEIMEHKYLMSEKAGKDVGLITAVRDFVKKYAAQKPPPPTIRSIYRALRAVFNQLPAALQTMYG